MSRASRHRKSTIYGPIGSCRTNLKLCGLRPRRLLHNRASAGMSARRRERARRIWRRGVKDMADPYMRQHRRAMRAGPHPALRATFSHASAWEKGKRFGGRMDVIVPERLAEGEILAEISDRRRAGQERCDGVLEGGGCSDHEVAEVERNRRSRCQRDPILDVLHDEPGSAGHAGAPGTRISHAPV